MGAWGTGTFENDTAVDWTYGLEDVDDLSLVEDAIKAVLDTGDEYLDSSRAVEALAACEVVARLQGRWGAQTSYSKTTDDWVLAHRISPSSKLIDDACRAIDRILAEPSELLELWDDGGRNDEWHAAVEALRERVRPGSAA